MTYEEALSYLNAPKYSQTRPGLGPVTELLKRLGNPEKGLKYVHITGTNGKGSTAAFMESALRTAGYKTGLYTSPFIEHFTERIRVAGEEIPKEDLARLTERVQAASAAMLADGLTEPTIFEMVTAVAFLYFQEQQCDIIVLEVGMGGRLDATNVIESAEVSVITRIAMDHTEFLGEALSEIAYEKAGIIKPHGVTVSYPQEPAAREVLEGTCRERESRFVEVDVEDLEALASDIHGQTYRIADGTTITIHKLGRYQMRNSRLAYEALKQLQPAWPALTDACILEGLAKAEWSGRLELMREKPVFLIDGAHNPNGVEALTESLRDLFPGEKFVFMTGVLRDKDYRSMLAMTNPLAERYLTVTPDSPRALTAEELRDYLQGEGIAAESFASIEEAARAAWQLGASDGAPGESDGAPEQRAPKIVAFGSLYYIGALRSILKKIQNT